MKKILIAPIYAMCNLSESNIMSRIASAFVESGHEVYVLGEGRYDDLFADSRYARVAVPFDREFVTDEAYRNMHNIDNGGLAFFSEQALDRFIAEEVRILREIEPDVVVHGFRPTMSVSTKITGTPSVCVLSAVVSDLYEKYGLKTIPFDSRGNRRIPAAVQRLLGGRLTSYIVKRFILVPKWYGTWNRVMKKHGLAPFRTVTGALKGDFNIMLDAPELFPFDRELPPYYRFCGPLLYEYSIETPACLRDYKKNHRPVVFLNMGSSGDPETIRRLIQGFGNRPYDVFCATTSILSEEELKDVPDNVFTAKMFPPFEVAGIADVALIHGGIGTLYSTLLGGTPFVGIPMFGEQQWNLENAARKGCGVVIPKPGIDIESVYHAIDEILQDSNYKTNVLALQKTLDRYRHTNPAKTAVDRIVEFLDNPSRNKSYFDHRKY